VTGDVKVKEEERDVGVNEMMVMMSERDFLIEKRFNQHPTAMNERFQKEG